eukprot:11500528-Alexandrium_andersonii.AAC.1
MVSNWTSDDSSAAPSASVSLTWRLSRYFLVQKWRRCFCFSAGVEACRVEEEEEEEEAPGFF